MNTSKINKLMNFIIKLVILVASYLYIYFQIINKTEFQQLWNYIVDAIPKSDFIYSITAIIILMLLNWFFEAIKWKYLVARTEIVSLPTAFRAVWAGITVSTFTPNRIGEFFGRVFLLKKTNPWEGAFMTIVGSFSQFIVTLIFGTTAIIIFFMNNNQGISSPYIIIASLLLSIISLLIIIIYFNVNIFENIFIKLSLKKWTKFRNHLKIFSSYKKTELLTVLSLSLIRYIIFSLQFYWLLRLFHVPLPFFDGLIIIACVYYCMAAVPTIALSELGVRGSLTLFFVDIYFTNDYINSQTAAIGAVSAATILWIINLVIPAIIGGIFVLQLKFFRK